MKFILLIIFVFIFSTKSNSHRLRHRNKHLHKDIFDDYGYDHPMTREQKAYYDDFAIVGGKLMQPEAFRNDVTIKNEFEINSQQEMEDQFELENSQAFYDQELPIDQAWFNKYENQKEMQNPTGH